MEFAGAPLGNKNAAKDRHLRQALLEAAAKRANGDQSVSMLELAMAVWEEAITNRERWAFEFIRDTVDGKPKQQMEVSGEDGAPLLTAINVNLVKPSDGTAG